MRAGWSDDERVGVAVLGSTGSIGQSTLDVIRRNGERYRVAAVAARSQVESIWPQVKAFEPALAALAEPEAAAELARRVKAAGLATEVLAGDDAICDIVRAPGVDAVMAAIVGAAGLRSTLAAAEAGRRVLLANKEALVMAGGLVQAAARRGGATLLPIDSEHNAIFQCLPPVRGQDIVTLGVERLLLTASGGPFLRSAPDDLERVGPDEACAHPQWSMGRKISVDSATMMNKGLEVIEACWLFGIEADRIDVVIHPQSVVHSLVRYVDGSTLAELGHADMRTPIAHALAWPERIDAGVEALDLFQLSALEFERPDTERFPSLALALTAARQDAIASVRLNAANEVAVDAFLEGRLAFPAISQVVADVLALTPADGDTDSVAGVLAADSVARAEAATQIASRSRNTSR